MLPSKRTLHLSHLVPILCSSVSSLDFLAGEARVTGTEWRAAPELQWTY